MAKKVRFGLIGYGAWGTHHARAIAAAQDADLVAIAARSQKSREAAKAAHPAVELFSEYTELLPLELDIIAVALPSHLHHQVGLAVLQAGKHLLLEKPMALNLGQCDELIAVAKSTKRILALGHEMRHSPLWKRAKEMIDAGAIGEPLYAMIELWRKPYRFGSGGWRYDIERVGNWILEEPIHFFDLARWYFESQGEPVSVYARASHKQPDHPELQDNFSAFLNFKSGAYAVISQTLGGYEHHQCAKITGTKGALWAAWSGAMDRTFTPSFSLKHFDGEQVREELIQKMAGEVFELEEQVQAMIRAVRDGTSPAATGLAGKSAVALCLAASESARTGQVIPLSYF